MAGSDENTASQPDGESDVRVGDVIKVSDLDTGFSTRAKSRWCMVTRIFGEHVRVAGRSASSSDGVSVPASAMAAFDRDGVFFRPGARISLSLALACERVGQLPEPYRTQVLFYLNEELP